MKKNMLLTLIFLSGLIVSCTKETRYKMPLDENGNAILTGISVSTSDGVSTLDDQFTVNTTFATAKAGDVMTVECLQLQVPPGGGGTNLLLPIEGTQKMVTVGNDLKVSVTYTRAEANLVNADDYVIVTFAGDNDDAKLRVNLVNALSVSNPKVGNKEVDVARTSENAYFSVTIEPKEAPYTGSLLVKRKNGQNDAEVDVTGSPFSSTQPFLVPISGDNFAVGKDTMYYTFTAKVGPYTDVVSTTVIVREPYFYLKKSATLLLGGSSAGRNLLNNSAVAENSAHSMISISGGTLNFTGGSTWLAAGNTIEFVPSTIAMFDANNVNLAKAAFAGGTPSTAVDPSVGTGVYIYKIVNGPNASDVYYGLLKITGTIPGVSVAFEYRIGDQYIHLDKIQ